MTKRPSEQRVPIQPVERPILCSQYVEPFSWLLERIIWHGEGHRDGKVFKTHGAVYVPDLYEAR